ncbi:MAG: hypothetical protein A2298_04880 [Gammaproteobacteria bacterium RIFOXYB2_FULL_38_6]|nr:MAG: hypothetical protein A2298_04880 [Gammaproteobacteria bacterium RIFOXYB2_FULL_38_6]
MPYHLEKYLALSQASDTANWQNKTDIPLPAKDCLNQQSLQFIVQKAKRIYALNQKIQDFLPTELASHCWIINYSDDVITIGIDEAEWIASLKNNEQDLLEKLRFHANLAQVKKVQCIVRPVHFKEANAADEKSAAPLLFPKQHRSLLQAIAEAVTDPALKKALLNLVR